MAVQSQKGNVVTQTATKPQQEFMTQPDAAKRLLADEALEDSREWQAEQIRVLWVHRRIFLRAAAIGLLVSTVAAFVIPKSYTAKVQLMPPDPQSASSMAMMAALAAKAGGGGLGTVAGDLLGLKSSGALFVGMLKSQTAQDQIVEQFGLRNVYGKTLLTDARTKLEDNTSISEDRKSGIITLSVSDHSPQRAASLANAYVDELNSLVSELSTSSAHRERVFLEQRLKVAKEELDSASEQLAQFSSKNNTLDIQQEGKAMLDAAGVVAGQMIAAESQLEGLREIYTDNSPRVRALNARVEELRRQLDKLGGNGNEPKNGTGHVIGETSVQSGSSLPYPTIRSLPLLGAKYSDFYRRAKIQETVYELLTEQYELARVQEAKETPSVKVLDRAIVPEKKSSPPRFAVSLLGTFLAVAGSMAWVWGGRCWAAMDPHDPRKILAQEVGYALRLRLPWMSRNGFGSVSSAQIEHGPESRMPSNKRSLD